MNQFSNPKIQKKAEKKAQEAIQEKYGVMSVSCIPEVAKKQQDGMRKTLKKTYGVTNIRLVKGTEEKIAKFLKESVETKRQPLADEKANEVIVQTSQKCEELSRNIQPLAEISKS